jgi:CheY-like chemotaxis protein
MNGPEPSGALVLVVEDSQDLQAIYEIILSEAGYRVAVAPEGRSGLDLACSLEPSVVVLDMMMPDMDGLEFLERLPSCVQPAPPVVVSSGFREFETHARARGARFFLGKPVTPDELLAAVAAAIEGRAQAAPEPDRGSRFAAGREEARHARERLWARIDLDDPDLRAMLEGVLAWLSRYHGFGTGLVDLLREDRIYVEAGGTPKLSIDRELAFCSDVIDAGSSLVISNVMEHPVFAGHKASAYWGTRFYAGCPITLRSGLVVGTVCLIDAVPRRIGVGDMRILEYLAHRIAAHFEAMAAGERPVPFFEPPALFERAAIEVILAAQLAAHADVDLALAEFVRARSDPALLRRAAEAMCEAAGARFAAARWTAESVAFVCGGATPAEATERVIRAARQAGLAPDGVGVAECRLAAHPALSPGDVIGEAEAACRRAVLTGEPLVRVAVLPRAA